VGDGAKGFGEIADPPPTPGSDPVVAADASPVLQLIPVVVWGGAKGSGKGEDSGRLGHFDFSGCPNQEIGWTFLFNGIIIGACSYFGADSAT
jgi:hypothetical protein